jgi:alkylated DNA repair dioxygenase AlkB
MEFRRHDGGARKTLWLPPRSLTVLQGEARYLWSHGIASRKMDKVRGPRARGSCFSLVCGARRERRE